MQKRQKDLLRAVVLDLRHTLAGNTTNGKQVRGDLDRELARLGVAPDGTLTPFDIVANPATHERRARQVAEAELAGLPGAERPVARTELVEHAAYSWINRLLALRAMEARGLIGETLRPNPDYDGQPEALYILATTDPARAAAADRGWWKVIEDVCAGQAASLPGLFGAGDPNTALRPSVAALLHIVAALGGSQLPGFTLEDCDAAFSDPDATGWAYQFYQEEAKAQVYATLKAGGKVTTRAEIAAATQLFTEPYMVQWLLQNSLGRSYHEAYPASKLPETWPYYIRPERLDQPAVPSLAGLTVMDPCMGSGHFLREAFDMLAAMYREQQPVLTAAEIAGRILGVHLHGIDIDPRAAQLAALTLYLRAWELVRDERKSRRVAGLAPYRPPVMNLATTPSRLDTGVLDRHLRRHPEDLVFKDLLEEIFASLEQAGILGSLLKPEEHLDAGINKLRRTHTQRMDSDPTAMQLRATVTRLIQDDPADAKRLLLERVAAIFNAEAANTGDVGDQLFGREAEQGVRLVQLLDRHYAVVVTNPPYMGSANMDRPLRSYVERQYPAGKRDLYATFIQRCLQLAAAQGKVAMVTQQSWMFLRSFADLRKGILEQQTVDCLAHLGPRAFEEISGEVVNIALFVVTQAIPRQDHRLWAARLIGPKSPAEKDKLLREVVAGGTQTESRSQQEMEAAR
ncbi:MAG: BREX-1 system adenine-specific DNA-methyltransferase PglX [Chloroflexi bacterium]|nr:BREX-1 system adenine-specific DNA-methyltransferase PglX [Chloroflexota bacterium]